VEYISATQTVVRGPVPVRGGLDSGLIDTINFKFVLYKR